MTEEEFRSQDNTGGKKFAERLDDVVKVAASPGNAHADHYLRGMANGLILAQAMLKDVDPVYIEAEAVKSIPIEGFDYVAEAHVTLSPEFHGNRVSRQNFSRALNDSIEALNKLDKVKKSLFYGRDNNLDPAEGLQDCSHLPALIAGEYNRDVPYLQTEAELLIHGIIGLATEAGELLELLKDTINGKMFDKTNLQEEVGDGKWYMAILARVGGFMWGDDERLNILKLRARFPDKFTEYDANNRNLAAERTILEGDAVNQLSLPINERLKPMEGETHVEFSPEELAAIKAKAEHDAKADDERKLARYQASGGYVPQFSKSGDNI